MTGKEFAGWLDERGIAPVEAAGIFGIAEQNIYNWRSTRGVPPSKTAWVEKLMAEYDQKSAGPTLPDRVSLEVDPQTFDQWSRAALAEGKILREWAIAVLNEAAEEEDSTGSGDSPNPTEYPALRAAEPKGPDYGTKKE
jgi:hypothetical protein